MPVLYVVNPVRRFVPVVGSEIQPALYQIVYHGPMALEETAAALVTLNKHETPAARNIAECILVIVGVCL